MIKHLLIAIMATLPFALFSCESDSDDHDDGIDDSASIVLSSDSVIFSKSGGTAEVKITTNASPISAVSKDDWLTVVSLSAGEPSVLTLKANTHEGYSERRSMVTLTCGQTTKDIIVTQEPADLLIPDESTKINGVLQPIRPNWEGVRINVNYQTNGDPKVTYPWWVKEVAMEKKDGYEVNRKFDVLGNYGKERKGGIKFTLGEETFTVQIEQGKTVFKFDDVNKSANDVASEFRCGWTFTGCGSASLVSDFEEELVDSVLAAGINVIRVPFLIDSASLDVALANLKKTVEAITARKVNEESAFAIVSLSNNNLRDLTTWDSAHIFRDYDIIWSRIADALAQYDYHVLFEAYDQIPNTGNHTDVVLYSRLNQIFVDAVRHTGANNFKRCLIIPGGSQESGVYVQMPTDEENTDRLMTSFSFFRPADYVLPNFTKRYWGAEYEQETTDWSNTFTENDIKTAFSYVHSKLWRVPILLNSFGTVAHGDKEDNHYSDCEARYVRFVAETAKEESFTPIIYDDGVCGNGSFGIFNSDKGKKRTERRQYIKSYIEGCGYQYAQ